MQKPLQGAGWKLTLNEGWKVVSVSSGAGFAVVK
jgi:hypothetical protein